MSSTDGITVGLPTFIGSVDQKLVIEALKGPIHPGQYTDRFPDEIYNKAPESHLVRFLYTLLGPAGVGELRKESFEARLALEAQDLAGFGLDLFYADAFRFGRIVEETWDEDPTGLLNQEDWARIRARDESYRSRAIDFLNAARAGNTPLGMKLAARSGLGHEVEIIENYRYLFDQHSDDPIGLDYYGRTRLLNEMIVLPRREDSRAEEQRLTITGNPTGGSFSLVFNGQATAPIQITYPGRTASNGVTPRTNMDRFDIQSALQALPNIGPDGVWVDGGGWTWNVRFAAHLGNANVPLMSVLTSLTGGSNPDIEVSTVTDGLAPFDEIVHITASDKYQLQTAVDRIKSVTTLPTLGEAPRLRTSQGWKDLHVSSEYNEVVRYVTGQPGILWPSAQSTRYFNARVNWIERGIEKEAPKVQGDLQYHYAGFHNVSNVTVSSTHRGRFGPAQRALTGFSYLSENTDDTLEFTGDRVLADYAEPLTVSTTTKDGTNLINGIYPTNYLEQPGVPTIQYADEQFWASQEAATGDEWIEIDLGTVSAVNFLAFEVSRKPIHLGIAVDVLDQDERVYEDIYPTGDFAYDLVYDATEQNPWFYGEWHFRDGLGRVPLTRHVKITLSRREDIGHPFLYDPLNNVAQPWSIEVRNLRVGRNVSGY